MGEGEGNSLTHGSVSRAGRQRTPWGDAGQAIGAKADITHSGEHRCAASWAGTNPNLQALTSEGGEGGQVKGPSPKPPGSPGRLINSLEIGCEDPADSEGEGLL